jgi:hypothetical protein
LKFQVSVYCGPVGSVSIFCEVELGLTSKIEFLPNDLLYTYANLKIFLRSGSSCFKSPNSINQSVSRLRIFFQVFS